jgi:hypothetical protein
MAERSDVVLIDSGVIGFDVGSFVRNDPFLTQRPKVMLMVMMDKAQLSRLCSQHSVSVWDLRNPAGRGVPTFKTPGVTRRAAELRAHLRAIGCAT